MHIGKGGKCPSQFSRSMSKIIHTILILNLLFVTPAFAKSAEQKKIIKLAEPSESKKIIYETDLVVMTFGYTDFTSYFKKLDNDLDFLDLMQGEIKKGDKILLNNFLQETDNDKAKRDEVERVIAELLENGKVLLYNKKSGNNLGSIIVIKYYKDADIPMTGFGGRIFLLPEDNTSFFKIIDWVS